MSFFGKKYKKVKSENLAEILAAINIPDKVKQLLNSPNVVSSFEKNDDGSVQHVLSVDNNPIVNSKLEFGIEYDHTGFGDITAKVTHNLNDNIIKSVYKLPDGKVVHLERRFEGNSLKQVVNIEGTNSTGEIYYEAV